ncbi:hypothetical protein EVAR_90341_1 [Eumeta japonica]|uniref:Uncharacterized protein n=1 Tax=Eumeta variegata TaxID=151549 RepID=A0A4C1YK12_EUMVA|nr:hypothetical protein EVAR_90341_1 [Eumeta japonica]
MADRPRAVNMQKIRDMFESGFVEAVDAALDDAVKNFVTSDRQCLHSNRIANLTAQRGNWDTSSAFRNYCSFYSRGRIMHAAVDSAENGPVRPGDTALTECRREVTASATMIRAQSLGVVGNFTRRLKHRPTLADVRFSSRAHRASANTHWQSLNCSSSCSLPQEGELSVELIELTVA